MKIPDEAWPAIVNRKASRLEIVEEGMRTGALPFDYWWDEYELLCGVLHMEHEAEVREHEAKIKALKEKQKKHGWPGGAT